MHDRKIIVRMKVLRIDEKTEKDQNLNGSSAWEKFYGLWNFFLIFSIAQFFSGE